MVAQIDPMWNIDAYLYPQDISDLRSKTVKGVLVRQQRPSERGLLEISVNQSTILKSTDKNFHLPRGFAAFIQIPPSVYHEIVEGPATEYWHNLCYGGKIAFHNIEQSNSMSKLSAELLLLYIQTDKDYLNL